MARSTPLHPILGIDGHIFTILLHGVLTLSVVYALVALVFSLCIPRKKSSASPSSTLSPPPSSSSSSSSQHQVLSSTSPPMTPSPGGEAFVPSSEHKILLPPPPPMNLYRNHSVSGNDGGGGRKKLMVSLSQKLTRSWSKREGGHKVRGKSMSTAFNDEDDLIWKKQIILGERCKVPHGGEEEEEEEEEAVFDDRGNKVSAYHPRKPRSLPVSRTTSAIDTSTINYSSAFNS